MSSPSSVSTCSKSLSADASEGFLAFCTSSASLVAFRLGSWTSPTYVGGRSSLPAMPPTQVSSMHGIRCTEQGNNPAALTFPTNRGVFENLTRAILALSQYTASPSHSLYVFASSRIFSAEGFSMSSLIGIKNGRPCRSASCDAVLHFFLCVFQSAFWQSPLQ